MSWNRYYTSPATVASFIFGELCYKKPIDLTTKLTGIKNSYASYVDRSEGVLSEHILYEEDDFKAEFAYRYFLDKNQRDEYFEKTRSIINEIQEYIKSIEDVDLSSVSPDTLLKLVQKAEPIYNKSMGYYLLSQPEYTEKLSKVFLLNLEVYVPKQEAQSVFLSLVETEQISCLEDERLDWLQNIVAPNVRGDEINMDSLIEEHIQKYKYLAASAQSKPWDREHFDKIFEHDTEGGIAAIDKEITEIEDKERRVRDKKEKLIQEYEIPQDLVSNVQILADLGHLRLEAHLRGWQFFQYFGPVLVEAAAKALDLKLQDVYNLTFEEFTDLLAGNLLISDDHISRRDGDILVVITPEKGEQIYFSSEAKNKYEDEMKEEIVDTEKISGQTVNGKGKLEGEVFVFRWGEDDIKERIYDFPEGRILVAGQTLPLFMPAIRKAKAIITNEGGVLCHAAIVSRELDKPAIIGTKFATEIFKDGDRVEMDLDNETVRKINT